MGIQWGSRKRTFPGSFFKSGRNDALPLLSFVHVIYHMQSHACRSRLLTTYAIFNMWHWFIRNTPTPSNRKSMLSNNHLPLSSKDPIACVQHFIHSKLVRIVTSARCLKMSTSRIDRRPVKLRIFYDGRPVFGAKCASISYMWLGIRSTVSEIAVWCRPRCV